MFNIMIVLKVPMMHWPFSPPQSLFHEPFQRKISQLQANPLNSFPQISPNKALLMHHLTPNTWPFGQQTALPHLPPPSSKEGVKTCPISPKGMLGKEGLHICPRPRAERLTERDREGNIPSSTRKRRRGGGPTQVEGKYGIRNIGHQWETGCKWKSHSKGEIFCE